MRFAGSILHRPHIAMLKDLIVQLLWILDDVKKAGEIGASLAG